MTDIHSRLAAVSDSRGRIIAIAVVAVLLPSIALSVLSFNAIPKHAENLKLTLLRHANELLYYVEQDLEKTARLKALEAARAIGPERLLEGRPREIQTALREAGLGEVQFESLRLEAWSSVPSAPRRRGDAMQALNEALLSDFEPRGGRDGEDAVPLTRGGEDLGVVRFRFRDDYAHRRLLRDFFRGGFVDPQNAWVLRVAEPEGEVLYENAPTRSNEDFEVTREMAVPSFKGLRLELRYRDRSIEAEARRLAIARTALLAFIDLTLLAGLALVWSNVRRELRLSRLKSDFVANVSHELKTPLALIRLFAETLELGRVPNEEKALQYHRIINKESRRLTQLINNILDFSRIEAGRKEYRFVRGDLGAVVHDVVEAYRFQAEQQGFDFKLDLAEDLPKVPMDPEAMSRALINLVNNAIKYSPDEKRIRILARRTGDRVRVSVSDKGIGIPKSEQKKVFDKFYRAESSLIHTTKGSGLGLALVRHIVEAHGGEVELVSAPGEGSTFTLVLPIDGPERRGGGGPVLSAHDVRAAAGTDGADAGRSQEGSSIQEMP